MECAGRLLDEAQVTVAEAAPTKTKKSSGGSSELQKLREENNRLKRTLADRFEENFE
jgi:hypothetical protein